MKTWTMTISVAGTWIDDGFDLTPHKLKEAILERLLPFAEDDEVNVKVANPAALLASTPSKAKAEAARSNGKKGGRPVTKK